MEIEKHIQDNNYPHRYPFTITFASMSVVKKFKLIDALPKHVCSRFWYYKQPPALSLFYTIEYHKMHKYKNNMTEPVSVTNNHFAPHMHGVISTDKMLHRNEIEEIRKFFYDKYGRTEISFQENPLEVIGWVDYCNKHVKDNDSLYPSLKHSYLKILDVVHYRENKLIRDIFNEPEIYSDSKSDC